MATIERSVFIQGREWTDKTYGNTYFCAFVHVDGKIVAELPFQYGYGDQYIHEAQKTLQQMGYIPEGKNHIRYQLDLLGVDFYSSMQQVKKNQMIKEKK